MPTRILTTMLLISLLGLYGCECLTEGSPTKNAVSTEDFPRELVEFTAYKGNPVFAGTGRDTWDRNIRERGYIMREGDTWHLWYTGYNHERSKTKYLGYATSSDGLNWTRYPGNPIFDESWVEDVFVVKDDDTYYMFAEGLHDIPHMLTSKDRIHWQDHGKIDIRYTNGEPLSAGCYGTPTVYIEGKKWYLFYERRDIAIWLAVSDDHKVWTNVQDEPVLRPGPVSYDSRLVALNQIVKYKGKYYAYYHGLGNKELWGGWTTNVAVSEDLIHWKKYPRNPILLENKSSGILVYDGRQYLLYSMHPDVRVHYPKNSKKK